MTFKIKSDFSLTEMENKLSTKTFVSLGFVMISINLFFIQALRAFIPGIYVSLTHVVFGEDVLINTIILLAFVFFFLPALTNTISKKIGLNRLMILSIYIIAVVRFLMVFHIHSKLETIFAGLIVTFYGFFMSTFLTLWIKETDDIDTNHKILFFILLLFAAFLIDYFIRTVGITLDLSLVTPGLIIDWTMSQYFWLFIQVPLSILCIYLTKVHFLRFSDVIKPEKPQNNEKYSTKYSLIFVGIGLFLFLQFNLFIYPNAIAQFTATNYYFNNILNIIFLMITICLVLFVKSSFLSDIKIIAGLNLFLIISLILFFFFPKDLTYMASIFVSISLIVMYLNLYLLFSRMAKITFKWEKVKTISNAFTIGLLFMVLFSVLHIFTTEWATIGEFLKGLGPLIMLLAGIIFSISTFCAIIFNSDHEVFKR
ncbi:MAG: hypothetical protein ACFFA6_03010 [Promethearchaeota archaeon]